jgi:ESX secretion system protein EccE
VSYVPTVQAHGTHIDALGDLSLTLPPAGLVLGFDRSNALVVRLFRSDPVRICVVSVGQLAQLIAYRALAVGAHVTVVTDAVAAWSRLVSAVPRGPAWLTVLPTGARVSATGSLARPSLVVDATRDHQALPRWEQGDWQTFVSVQSTLEPADETRLRTYDLLVAQRLDEGAADVARRGFGLAKDRASWLTQMPGGVVGVAAAGQLAFGQLSLSAMEQRLFAG